MSENSTTKPINGAAAPAPRERRTGWVKLMRSEETKELLRDPLAFALLANIAMRARWHEGFNVHNLKPGEALIGDYKKIGFSRREYRTRLDRLEKWGFVTTKATNKGTVATLCNSTVFDLASFAPDQLNDQRPAIQRPTADHPEATNEEGQDIKQGKQRSKSSPPRAAEEELKFPDGLDVEEFRTSFTEWMNFRRGLPGKVKNWSAVFAKQLAWLAPFGPNVAREILDQSLRNGWKGVFPLKQNNTNNRNNHAPIRQHHAPAPAAGSEW